MLVFSAPMRAGASGEFANFQNLLFVAGRDVTEVAAIAVDTNEVVGSIDFGLAPSQMKVSESLARISHQRCDPRVLSHSAPLSAGLVL
jgi:hypothetical protein